MKNLDRILEKMYNTMGNKYLIDNFDTGPFEFRVNVRRGDRDDDLQDYIVEVYSTPEVPRSFRYKPDNENKIGHRVGIDISVLGHKFKEYASYVDPSFGKFRKTIGVKFMNVDYFPFN